MLAAAGGPLALHARGAVAGPPPEITTLTLAQVSGLCVAPQYLAEEPLRAEGFTKVRYLKQEGNVEVIKALSSGEAQISLAFVAPFVMQLDTGDPIVLLGGVHVGCFELFANERVRAIRELKGKTVAVPDVGPGSSQYVFLASILAYVGLDPRKDINWVIHPRAEGMRLLAENKIDAFMGFPPDPQELRAKQVGHVVVNSAADRPWSQYFCCMVASSREFVRKHPVATKRALRAILKATDLCALEPDRAARTLVDKGLEKNYTYAVQSMREVPYNRWREYDPEDTVRFYALRLHEAGMVKSNPNKLIAQGTDWRFLKELKSELKA
jgi:NitT/TauT family transport system substrate-binding protein